MSDDSVHVVYHKPPEELWDSVLARPQVVPVATGVELCPKRRQEDFSPSSLDTGAPVSAAWLDAVSARADSAAAANAGLRRNRRDMRYTAGIAPAIRAGAERLVVISVRHARSMREVAAVEEADNAAMQNLSPVFLVGKLLNALLLDPVQVVVVGSGPEAARLEAMAVARYEVNKTVMRVAPFRLVPGGVPDGLAEMLLQAPRPKGHDVYTIVCRGRTCLPPITDAEELLKALEGDE